LGAGASIAADGYALIVPIDPVQFRSQYGIPAEVAIFGPYSGQLSNGGEKLTLSKPGVTIGTITGSVVVDRVNYDNQIPWPAAAADHFQLRREHANGDLAIAGGAGGWELQGDVVRGGGERRSGAAAGRQRGWDGRG